MLTGFFWVYTAICVIPILLVLAVSFTDETTVVTYGYNLWPKEFSVYAYEFLFKDSGQIVNGYLVSIFVTVVGTFLVILLTALYAYPISRQDFPFKSFFSFIMFFTMLFGGGLVPTYLVFTKFLMLKNTIWALIVPLLIQPFYVIIMRTFFAGSLPPSVIESARIDGAGEARTFFSIVLPLSLPVLATVGMFSTLAFWNDWFNSLLYITNGNMVSLQYLMYKVMMNIQVLTNGNLAGFDVGGERAKIPSETVRMAMAIIGIGPICLAYPYFQKYFVKGLTVGAVKG